MFLASVKVALSS